MSTDGACMHNCLHSQEPQRRFLPCHAVISMLLLQIPIDLSNPDRPSWRNPPTAIIVVKVRICLQASSRLL